ncbi:hypothetical protein CDD82_448 [Ophiocordyceps australis]|uniref:Uncharacterized protein n=1 Tax=Ophiocordyceps australis TaxID=1399860 RepID=A0A2C5Y6I4_9HYPO|nr:hypothetical protein CDD82_448 [Ophiocordyceps australis]
MGRRPMTPGGALLRSSRMFSLPKPLPDLGTMHSQDQLRHSPTMTQHTPRYQAIASPFTSREKGDWGLKRQMPLKTTLAVSSPSLRIRKVDTRESVTDFTSAADHVVSLEKFQHLGVCMVTRPPPANSVAYLAYNRALADKSVYEEETDSTNLTKTSTQLYQQRWKFRGPDINAMVYGVFLKYLRDQVQPQKAAFNEFIRRKMAENLTSRQRQEAKDQGEEPPPEVLPDEINDQELLEYICVLRNDRFTLSDLVSNFLDVVPCPPPAHFIAAMKNSSTDVKNPYSTVGPPPSHPAAGISYLRTSSCLDNHPLYGPQENPEPALARVVSPRIPSMPARLGVGGFVAYVPSGNNEFNKRTYGKRSQTPKGISHLDLETPGGSKVYIEAKRAHVDSLGRIVLNLNLTSQEAELNVLEKKGLKKVYNNKPLVHVLHVDSSWEGDDSHQPNPIIDQGVYGSEGEGTAGEETDIMSSSEAYGLGSSKDSDF